MRRGFTVVELLIALALVALLAAIATPHALEARRHRNEAAAIGALKTIVTAQWMHHEDRAGQPRPGARYLDLRGLGQQGLIDGELSGGAKQGYLFEVQPSTTTPEWLWWVTARPEVPRLGGRCFCANQSGIIFYSSGARPGPLQPPRDTCAIPDGALPACGK